MGEDTKRFFIAGRIVEAIFADVSQRKGISNAFAECDADIIDEIKSDWTKEIVQILRRS